MLSARACGRPPRQSQAEIDAVRHVLTGMATLGTAFIVLWLANGKVVLLHEIGPSTQGVAAALLACAVHSGLSSWLGDR